MSNHHDETLRSSAGELPLHNAYHRASSLGAGTFGSVVTVYNEDGDEFALKCFYAENDHGLTDVEALREVSILRLLRHDCGHPNIIALADVQSEWMDDDDDEQARDDCTLGLALPRYPHGSLYDALTSQQVSLTRRDKVSIVHGLLSAVAYLHDNDILHRDLKSDNVLLEYENERWRPIVIDFSLARIVDHTMLTTSGKSSLSTASSAAKSKVGGRKDRHATLYPPMRESMSSQAWTTPVGTVGYTAPEVFANAEEEGETEGGSARYGKPVDCWSVGVILLEVLTGNVIQATKHKHAWQEIATAVEQDLPPNQPLPNMVRGLLQVDPAQRWTARQALQSEVFAKFDLPVPPVTRLHLATALPVDWGTSDEDSENTPPDAAEGPSTKAEVKRLQRLDRIVRDLEAQHPWTLSAAWEYSVALSQLDDVDDPESQLLLDCAVAAVRFLEVEALDVVALDEVDQGHFAEWSLADYVDTESTLLMLLNYCLHPRKLL